jgi:hypothetical protein
MTLDAPSQALVATIAALVSCFFAILLFLLWRWWRHHRRTRALDLASRAPLLYSPLNGSSALDGPLHLQQFVSAFPGYTFIKQLPIIGRRSRKWHALVKRDKSRILVSLYEFHCSDRLVNADPFVCSSLLGARPSGWTSRDTLRMMDDLVVFTGRLPGMLPMDLFRVEEVSMSNNQDHQIFIAHAFSDTGSLKDFIWNGVSPLRSAGEKYPLLRRNSPCPLSDKKLASYSRQILLSLFYLLHHGIPFVHLQTSNIILVDNGQCHLVGYENSLFALNGPYLTELVPMLLLVHQPASNRQQLLLILEKIMVVQFGHVLYEMATGVEAPCLWPFSLNAKLSKPVSEVLYIYIQFYDEKSMCKENDNQVLNMM